MEHWHYSGSLPPPPMRRIGVWETGRFVGCVLFARGASSNLLKPYGLKMTEGCELVRVALRDHWSPVSRIVAIALKILRRAEPGLRLVLSFADPAQGHHGGIYQAGGWLYLGTTASTYMYRDRAGKVWHNRMVSENGWRTVFGKRRRVLKISQCERIEMPGKHRYAMPLDKTIRRQLEPLARPYPKRVESVAGGTPDVQSGGGGSNPTSTLSV